MFANAVTGYISFFMFQMKYLMGRPGRDTGSYQLTIRLGTIDVMGLFQLDQLSAAVLSRIRHNSGKSIAKGHLDKTSGRLGFPHYHHRWPHTASAFVTDRVWCAEEDDGSNQIQAYEEAGCVLTDGLSKTATLQKKRGGGRDHIHTHKRKSSQKKMIVIHDSRGRKDLDVLCTLALPCRSFLPFDRKRVIGHTT